MDPTGASDDRGIDVWPSAWNFQVLSADGDIPAYGPNGEGCVDPGTEDMVDTILFDQQFTCKCLSGYNGSNCQFSDRTNCSGFGDVDMSGKCRCRSGYTGDRCADQVEALQSAQKTSPTTAIVAGSFGAMISVAVVLLVFLYMKAQASKKNRTPHDFSEDLKMLTQLVRTMLLVGVLILF